MEEIKKNPVTVLMMILNIAAFLVVEIAGGTQNIGVMLDWGAAYAPLIRDEGEYYRLFTSMFLHFGMEHLTNNMLVLFVLGSRLERSVGKIRFLLIYLVGGLFGNVVSFIYDVRTFDDSVSAGASGAVFAVMGAMLYVLIRQKGRVEDLSAKQIMIMAAFSLYFGFCSSGVDNVAHVCGLLGGFFAAFLVYHPKKLRDDGSFFAA